jgi:mRNA interferase MazF
MRRGEVWTAAGGKDYAGKPRPVVIVQSDAFDATESVTVCGLTTNPTEAPLARPVIEPNDTNGLKVMCRLMADKITTMPRTKLGNRVALGGSSVKSSRSTTSAPRRLAQVVLRLIALP